MERKSSSVELYSKVTDLLREQLGEGGSGLGNVCVQVWAVYRIIIFWSLFTSLLWFYNSKWKIVWAQGVREIKKWEESKIKGEERQQKLKNSNHAIGKGADYLSHIIVTWGLCSEMIVEHVVLYFSTATHDSKAYRPHLFFYTTTISSCVGKYTASIYMLVRKQNLLNCCLILKSVEEAEVSGLCLCHKLCIALSM